MPPSSHHEYQKSVPHLPTPLARFNSTDPVSTSEPNRQITESPDNTSMCLVTVFFPADGLWTGDGGGTDDWNGWRGRLPMVRNRARCCRGSSGGDSDAAVGGASFARPNNVIERQSLLSRCSRSRKLRGQIRRSRDGDDGEMITVAMMVVSRRQWRTTMLTCPNYNHLSSLLFATSMMRRQRRVSAVRPCRHYLFARA